MALFNPVCIVLSGGGGSRTCAHIKLMHTNHLHANGTKESEGREMLTVQALHTQSSFTFKMKRVYEILY